MYNNSCNSLKYLLLLQNTSKYPEAHPLSQCPLVELQDTLCKQFRLQLYLQSLPYIPFLQPVVINILRLNDKTSDKVDLFIM